MTYPDAFFSFGKHAGRRVSAVAQSHPAYILWCSTIAASRSNPVLWRALKAHLLVAAESIEQRHQQHVAQAEALAERRRQLRARRQAERDAAEIA